MAAKQASPWDKGAKPKPQVYFDQIDPDADGNATLWYRSREDAAKARSEEKPPQRRGGTTPEARGWKVDPPGGRRDLSPSHQSLVAPARRPAVRHGRRLRRHVPLRSPDRPDHLSAARAPGLAPYTTIVCGGKLYLSGYSGGHLFVFDPAQPWTLGKGGPPGNPAPDQADARSNPRYLGDFDSTTRVGLMHSSALGADGKIYFGGFGLRHYTGGGFGWYDPEDARSWTASGSR